MAQRTFLLMLLVVVSVGLTVAAGGTLSGYTSLETRFTPNGPTMLSVLDLDMGVTYSIGSVYYSSDGLVVLPGTWVWQGFSGGATFGAFSVETNLLFSGQLADYLYSEAIVELPILGIDLSFQAAQLGTTASVQSGSQKGWAVRAAVTIGSLDIVSITEFGARIDDGGITIVHAPTGRERHYATDSRAFGIGFSGQKLTMSGFSSCCGDIDIIAYLTGHNGLEYVSFSVPEIKIETLPWLTLAANLEFKMDEKTLELVPKLDIGEILCLKLFSRLMTSGGAVASDTVEAITISGLELTCQIGPVTLRDVSILDQHKFGVTTENTGNQVMLIDDILDKGYEYYPDYWEMFSLAYTGEDCCENVSTFLLNFFFERNGAQLFDLAMIYAETSVQLSKMVTMSLGTRTTLPGVDYIKVAFDVTF